MKVKRIFTNIISILLVILYIFPSSAIATSSNIKKWPYYSSEITSKAAFIMDANSSKVLYEHNSNQRLYPASLTKIMTAIIVLEHANNYDDLVTFSYNSVTKDIDKNSTTIGASAGDQLSIKDCLYSLLLPSANDVANALAEHVAGSIKDFVLLMNEKAESLGLKDTNFVNPSGLHDDNQYTTASDMAKILNYAMSYPIFMQITTTVSYRHAPIRKFRNPENSNNLVLNTNSIMIPGNKYYYNGVTSGKTGYTSSAGYNLATSARKNGMNLICIVLGSKNEATRFNETKELFDFYFDNYKSLSIIDIDDRFNSSVSTMAINDVILMEALNITCDSNTHITLPKDADINKIKSVISFQVDDIYNKYAIGSISYYFDDEFIGKCTLEGKNIEAMESIYTNYLNLSNSISVEDEADNNPQTNHNRNSSNTLITKSNNGNLVISNTLIVLIEIIILLIVLILLILIIYTYVINNPSLPTNKIMFKIKRFFKH